MYSGLYTNKIHKETVHPFKLPEWIALAPFEEYLGMRIESASDGQAVLTMPFRVAHCQGKGLMHGGAVVALADTSLAIAIKTVLPEGSHFATVKMDLEFHAPVCWGVVTAKARIVGIAERDIKGEVEIVTEEGIKAATFNAIFRKKRSSVSQQVS
jgi:acyl-CoA thioesterase